MHGAILPEARAEGESSYRAGDHAEGEPRPWLRRKTPLAVAPLLRLIPLAIAKTLTKLFGLATASFFGRAPSRDDHKVALVGILSLSWLAILPAVFIPSLAETFFPFLPSDETLLFWTTLSLVVAGGPLVGVLIGRTANRKETGGRLALTALQGYLYALVIGGLTLVLILVVPVVKSSHLLRGLEMHHMAIMTPPGRFERTEQHIHRTLRDNGIETERRKENPVMAAIFKALVWVEEKIFRQEMANKISILKGDGEQGPVIVELHPTDIAVRARRKDASYAFAVLAEELDGHEVYLSWDRPSKRLEDRIEKAREAAARGEPVEDEQIDEIAQELRSLGLEPDQWSAIRRLVHQLEAETLRARLQQKERSLVAGTRRAR